MEQLGNFQTLVLAATVAANKNSYGVPICKIVSDFMQPRKITVGTVYVTLDRLEKKKLLKSVRSEPLKQRGGRSRRYFRITSKGARVLSDSMRPIKRAIKALEKGPEDMPEDTPEDTLWLK